MREVFQSNGQPNEAARLAGLFREMKPLSTQEQHVFEELEADLEQAGFSLAEANEVAEVFQEQRLFCRSESFEKVMNLILREQELKIANYGDEANMCSVASGRGFRVAMSEGFSGKEVGGVVKVVITFSGENLTAKNPIEKDSRLWESKKETAMVSLKGKGIITSDDIRMVSFRFPIKFFPKELLSEDESDGLDDEKISFIVRHYIR